MKEINATREIRESFFDTTVIHSLYQDCTNKEHLHVNMPK